MVWAEKKGENSHKESEVAVFGEISNESGIKHGVDNFGYFKKAEIDFGFGVFNVN